MPIYRIAKDDDKEAQSRIAKIFENDADGMIILEKNVHVTTDKYNIKYIDDTGNKYIVLGRRERNKTYKRHRVNVGLLHIIDYRVNNIMHIMKFINIMIVFNVLMSFLQIHFYTKL